MSELLQMMEEQKKEIGTLKSMVHDLTVLVMKDKVNNIWLDEEVAASMLGVEPRTLRKAVKNPKHVFRLINFRNTNGRNWQYSRKSIMEFQTKTSTAI